MSWHLSPSQWHTSWIPPIRLCVCMCIPLLVARKWLGRHVLTATNTCKIEKLLETFCIWSVSYQGRVWVCLCIPLSLLGNGSVNTFPRQQRIFGGVVFHMVCVISKESVGLSLYPLIIARQRLSKHVPVATKNFGGLVFYAVCIVLKESRRLVLTGTSCLSCQYENFGIIWE
jgi:hypothetical protein